MQVNTVENLIQSPKKLRSFQEKPRPNLFIAKGLTSDINANADDSDYKELTSSMKKNRSLESETNDLNINPSLNLRKGESDNKISDG